MATTPTITGNTPLIPSRTRSTRIPSQSNSGIVGILNSIQKSVKKIELVVASGFTIQKKQIDQQRRESLAKNRAKKEKESENIKLVNPFKFLQGALPRTGFLDALKNFILYTFMGLAFTKLYPLLPKLLVMAKGVKPFAKFLENFVGAVFNNFVGAIDLGYKQYDKVRALAKQIGGEKYEKQFDDLSSALNKFLNTAIIVGFAVAGSGAVGGGGGKKLPTKISPRPGVGAPGKSKRLGEFFNQTRAQEKITQKYGFDAARLYQDKINKGLSPAKALEAVKQRFTQRAIPTGNLAGKGRTPGRIGARGLKNVSNRAALKLFGKGGTKILGKVPIVGPIIDFLISTLIFKERPDRAASGAVGAAVGAALGSFPALLPFGGPIWGGLLGDIIGRSLFDAVSSMPNDKVQKKAKGGPITRGGRPIGRTKRTAPKIQKRLKRNKPQEPQAGKDIGGIKIIRKIYRSPKKIKPGKPNPLKTLEAISKIHSKNKDPLFGGIIAATSNLTIGQKPDPSLKQEIKNNFATLIDNAISAQSAKDASQIGKSILAAANGGTIQPPVTRTLKSGPTIGERLGDLIATSFQKSLDVRTNEIFNSIRRQLGIKDDDATDNVSGQLPGSDLGGVMPGTEIVGYVGTTGRSTGPHIHIETGDGYTGAGGNIPENVLRNIIVGGKSLFESARGDGLDAGRGHKGFDYTFNEGTAIQLKGDLRFLEYDAMTSTDDNAGYGNTIIIQDGSGKKYLLGHLKSGPANPSKLRDLKQQQDQENLRRMRPTGNSISGQASWYGPGFQGNRTASGEPFDTNKMTAAMYRPGWNGSNPFWVEVTNTANGKKVRVKVNDTGPFAMDSSGRALDPLQPHPTRIIDLSKAAMDKLGGSGVINVTVQKLGAAARVSTPNNPPATPPAAPTKFSKNVTSLNASDLDPEQTSKALSALPDDRNRRVVFPGVGIIEYNPGIFGVGKGYVYRDPSGKKITEQEFNERKQNSVDLDKTSSIQKVNSPSSTIAKFAPSENRQFQQVASNISKDDPTNTQKTNTIIAFQKVFIEA
jgi:rare lipoprotein A